LYPAVNNFNSVAVWFFHFKLRCMFSSFKPTWHEQFHGRIQDQGNKVHIFQSGFNLPCLNTTSGRPYPASPPNVFIYSLNIFS
jgi:hypothetical protein